MGCEGRVVDAGVVPLAAGAARLLGGRRREQLRKGWREPCRTAVHGKSQFHAHIIGDCLPLHAGDVGSNGRR